MGSGWDVLVELRLERHFQQSNWNITVHRVNYQGKVDKGKLTTLANFEKLMFRA